MNDAEKLEQRILEEAKRFPEISFAKLSRIAKHFYDFGKEQMAEQGVVEETRIITNPYNHLKGVVVTLGLESLDFEDNESVIVQIRKKEE